MSDKTRLMRRWLIGAWVAAALIMAGYYALWRYAAGAMEIAVIDWVDEQRAAGLIVEHGEINRDGFPFFLRLNIDAPTIEEPSVYAWSAEKLSIDALPYDFNRLIFSPSGAQQFTADAIGEWQYAADDFRASIANDKARGWVFSMNIHDLIATDANSAQAQLVNLVYDLAPAADAPTTLTLNLIGNGYSFRDAQREIAVESVETSLSLSRTDFLTGADPATRWRNAGGALEIHGLNVAINEATLSASGKIGLDEKNRPEGALTTMIERPAGLAAILTASGALEAEEAEATIAGLTLAAMAQGGRIETPITLHAGAATIAGVTIAELPVVD